MVLLIIPESVFGLDSAFEKLSRNNENAKAQPIEK